MIFIEQSKRFLVPLTIATISISTCLSADLIEKRPAPGTPAGGTNASNATTNRLDRSPIGTNRNTPLPAHGDSSAKREAPTKGVAPKPKSATDTKPELKPTAKTEPIRPPASVTNVPVVVAKEDVRINRSEQVILQKEISRHAEMESSKLGKGKKAKKLPPGLEKKAAKGGELPPGWQKKLSRGEVLPSEVLAHAEPLPDSVVAQLPPQPKGTVLRKIDDKIVRVREASREILDVLEIGSAKKN